MRRRLLVLVAAVPFSLLAIPAVAPAAVVASGDATTSAARSVAAYWTPARMRAAIRNSDDLRTEPFAAVAGLARPAPAQLPGMKAIGRVFSVKPDGTPWSCSGTLVDSRNRSVVWTAGHCIHTGRHGAFHSNLAFAPGYQPRATGNPAPYGIWPAFTSAATGSWTLKGVTRDFSQKIWKTAQYDAAGLVLVRDSAGRPAVDAVGAAHHLGFRVRKTRVRMIGYPLAAPYGGEILMQCGPSRTHTRRFAVNLLRIRCPLNRGMSGGPALTRINAAGVGTVVGEMTASDSVYMYVSFQGRELRRLYKYLDGISN